MGRRHGIENEHVHAYAPAGPRRRRGGALTVLMVTMVVALVILSVTVVSTLGPTTPTDDLASTSADGLLPGTDPTTPPLEGQVLPGQAGPNHGPVPVPNAPAPGSSDPQAQGGGAVDPSTGSPVPAPAPFAVDPGLEVEVEGSDAAARVPAGTTATPPTTAPTAGSGASSSAGSASASASPDGASSGSASSGSASSGSASSGSASSGSASSGSASSEGASDGVTAAGTGSSASATTPGATSSSSAAGGQPATVPTGSSSSAAGATSSGPATSSSSSAPRTTSAPATTPPATSPPATSSAPRTSTPPSSSSSSSSSSSAPEPTPSSSSAPSSSSSASSSAPRTSTPPAASATPSASAPSSSAGGGTQLAGGTWLSGASGDGVVSGAYGEWRGRPVEIAGTWNDNNQAMLGLWALRSSGDLGNWDKPLDIAVGAIGKGETWQAAATGAYDARWRESLTSLKKLWSGRSGTWYLRFAHEMNGNWYDWSVNSGNAAAFTQAWNRYRALQQQIFPESKLVFNINRETVGNNADWRKYWPGKENVDVFGVDYYNAYPYVATAQDWAASMKLTDGVGAPKGLQGHLDFARSQGLPMSISEWSGTAANGDNVAFMQGMYGFLKANGGSGAGQVLYEILFNVNVHNNSYRVFNGTAMPKGAEAYRALW